MSRRIKVSLVKRWCPHCLEQVRRAHPRARFCSDRCQARHGRSDVHALRAQDLGVPWERVRPEEVFARDGFVCHLCSKSTGPMGDVSRHGPTLDHLVPITLPGSPGHVWENVRTAHRSCNSSKRQEPVTEELVGRLTAGRYRSRAGRLANRLT